MSTWVVCPVCGEEVPWAGEGRKPVACFGPKPGSRSKCGRAWEKAQARNLALLRQVAELADVVDELAAIDPNLGTYLHRAVGTAQRRIRDRRYKPTLRQRQAWLDERPGAEPAPDPAELLAPPIGGGRPPS